MRALYLSWQCCIRCIKEGLMSVDAGVDVHFMQRYLRRDFADVIPSIEYFDDYPDLPDKLLRFEGDLIHVHNEPSGLGIVAKAIRPDLPMVFDCHDLELCRSGNLIDSEVGALGICDAVIYPSHTYKATAEKFFPRLRHIPNAIIYPMVLKRHIDGIRKHSRLPGIVYEGGVSTRHPYRDWRGFAKEMNEADIPFYVLGAKMDRYPQAINDYWNAGAVVMEGQTYIGMLNQLARFDWGIVGSPIPDPALEGAMPNKLFEYLAAGTPVIVMNAPEAAEWVTERPRMGLVVKDTKELKGIVNSGIEWNTGMREIINSHKLFMKTSEVPTMESQLDTLLGVYSQVLGWEVKKAA